MRSGLMGLVFVACGPSPTLTDLTPIVGSARGGEPVVVSGTDLYAGLGVELDGVAAEVLDVAQDGLSMTIATPAHLAGPVDVRLVDEDDAVLGVLGDAFAYEPIALDFIPAAAAYLPADVPDLRMAVPADIDEDGVLDLLVVETAGALRYWRGSGTGVFEAQPLPWTQGRVRDVAVADLNADGHLDIVTCFIDDEALRVLMGAGGGVFADRRDLPIDTGRCLDLSLYEADEPVLAVLRRTDRGDVLDSLTFADTGVERRLERGSEVSAGSCKALGGSCEVVPEEGGFAAEISGDATLGFSLPDDGRALQSVSVRVVESTDAQVRVWVDDAAGERFTTALAPGPGVQRLTDVEQWPAQGGDGVFDGAAAAVGLDVVATGGRVVVDDLWVRLDDGGTRSLSTFEQWPSVVPLVESWNFVQLLDVEADGDVDVVVGSARTDGSAALFIESAAALRPADLGRFPAPVCGLGSILWRDMTGDGVGDLVLPCRQGQDVLLRGDGGGYFFDDTVAAMPVDNVFSVVAEAADLNLDGRPELLMGTWGAVDRVYEGGEGRFIDRSPALGLDLTWTRQLLPLDVDQDGDLDLLAVGRDGARLFILQ